VNAEQTCRCGRPTQDQFVCDDCTNTLAVALGEIPWLEQELETTTTRTRGVDYRTKGGTPSTERPSPVAWSASDARTNLHGFLTAWVRYCHEHDIRNSSPQRGLPAENLTAMSKWLLWRVDGLALDTHGPAAVEQITAAVNKGKRLIDNPPEKMYAGRCGYETPDATCPNELYVKIGAKIVRCTTCGTEWDVPERRTWLLAEAEEVLATAVEISRAVSWLGTEPLNAATVRKWASRGRLPAHGHDRTGRPLYRVGDAIDLLSGAVTKGSAA
jgi:hypothetical protein